MSSAWWHACVRSRPYRLWFAGCRHHGQQRCLTLKHGEISRWWCNATTKAPAPSAIARAVVAPLAPHRCKVQLTIGQDTHDKLRRVQDLLRHSIPTGDPAAILDRALTLLLAELERTKCAATERPRRVPDVRKRSRHVPATVKRAVWSRDKGQCAFVGSNGRCPERGFLEFQHVQPHAAGGDTTGANIELRCRAHNNYEKDQFFGVLPSIVRERGPAYAVG